MEQSTTTVKRCLREPIPEIYDAARYLDAAVSTHLTGNRIVAEELIRMADMPAIRDWSESLWGAGGPWSKPLPVENAPPYVPKELRIAERMPSKAVLTQILARDGFSCRFCGIPVVRKEIRLLLKQSYPEAVRWGLPNSDQHFGLQAMWLQYDHLLPHARGGDNELSNLIVTCAPCNNGRSNLTLEEAGLLDPRLRPPVHSSWDGLERLVQGASALAPVQ